LKEILIAKIFQLIQNYQVKLEEEVLTIVENHNNQDMFESDKSACADLNKSALAKEIFWQAVSKNYTPWV